MPPVIREVYLDFDWDKRQVWALAVEAEPIALAQLEWHLDLPFWSSEPPLPRFDLRPRRVLADPSCHPVHADRIERAELRYPIDVMAHRGRLCVMDGLHRLAKAAQLGHRQLLVRRIPRARVLVRS